MLGAAGDLVDQSTLTTCAGYPSNSGLVYAQVGWDAMFGGIGYTPWYYVYDNCAGIYLGHAWISFRDVYDPSGGYSGVTQYYGYRNNGTFGLCYNDPVELRCTNSAIHMAVVYLNTGILQPDWFLTHQTIVHELGHPLGLDDTNATCGTLPSVLNFNCVAAQYHAPMSHDSSDVDAMY